MPDVATGAAGHRHEKYARLIQAAQRHPPVTTAIAHPCDEVSLESAVEAARHGLKVPQLV
jgi:phosphate acetyltransferase